LEVQNLSFYAVHFPSLEYLKVDQLVFTDLAELVAVNPSIKELKIQCCMNSRNFRGSFDDFSNVEVLRLFNVPEVKTEFLSIVQEKFKNLRKLIVHRRFGESFQFVASFDRK
jgi:hypothetical protein